MTVKIYVDFWNIAHMCHSVAQSTYENWSGNYTLLDVFTYILNGKLKNISDELLSNGIYDGEFVFVKDQVSVRKIMLYPDYKIHRQENQIPFNDALAFVVKKGYGRVCYSSMNEADDTIATLVSNGGGIIVSADKDLWQLIDEENIRVLNPFTKIFVTKADIEKGFACTFGSIREPKHIPLHKTLWGDGGDGVPNAIPRMQRYLLPLLRESDGTLENFKELVEYGWSSLSKRCRQLYDDNEVQMNINWELVSLDRKCEITWE